MAGLQRGAKPPWERRPTGVVTQADVVSASAAAVTEKFPVGADGRVYYETPKGSVVPVALEADPGTALHSNADFENVTASTPDIWDTFWQSGGSFTTETTDVLFGTRSATVATTAGANWQILRSNVFTVAGGDQLTVGVWAHAVTGSPKLQVGILTAASGTPNFFDGVSTGQSSESFTLAATFTKYAKTFPVPAGHTVAQMYLRFDPTAAEACSSRVDFTTSARTGASTPMLPGNSWTKETCRVATVANVATLAGGAPSVVDGTTLIVGDRVLVKAQSTTQQNGIYTVTVVGSGANGTWVRASDAATAAQIAGAAVGVLSSAGGAGVGSQWVTPFSSTSIVGSNTMPWYQMLSDNGGLVLSGTTGATMGSGSVGTGTFRDSVDARVQALAPMVHVGYRSTAAAQTITTATMTAMNIQGTADHDVGSGFSRSTDIVTVTNAGVYQLHAFCPFNTNTGNCRNLLRIETWTGSDPGVGAATIIAAAEDIGTTVQSNWMNCNTQRTFTAGAKVRVVLYHTQGTNATTQGNIMPHQLDIARLS